ncbi:hypothetical protein LTR49_021758 [Elasticomyces elasticus]|nr:hypothetical protein LTR49_021758 [Elasticomyces elasticus]
MLAAKQPPNTHPAIEIASAAAQQVMAAPQRAKVYQTVAGPFTAKALLLALCSTQTARPIAEPHPIITPRSSGVPAEQQAIRKTSTAQSAPGQQNHLPRHEQKTQSTTTITRRTIVIPTVPQPRFQAPPLAGIPQSAAYPDPLPVGFDDDQVTVATDEIRGLPDSIKQRVVMYNAMTKVLETWLIAGATALKYPDLASNTYESRQTESSMVIRRTRIKPPITRFENFATFLATKNRFRPTVADNVEKLIETRTFVSEFYKNVQNRYPKLPADCEVAQKTDDHVAFTDMLIRLRVIFRATKK